MVCRVGTRITIFDIDPSFDLVWDPSTRTHVALEARLRELLAANDLPGIELSLNGQSIEPMFSRRGGSRIRVDGDWGEGTTARVKAYRRSDRGGSYWIRLGGQFQFKSPSGGSLGADVVIDLTTSIRPGEAGYPLTAARDALQGNARWTFRDVVHEVEKENESVGRNQEDEVFEPEDPFGIDDAIGDDLNALAESALDDPEVAAILEQTVGHNGPLAALLGDQAKTASKGTSQPTSESADNSETGDTDPQGAEIEGFSSMLDPAIEPTIRVILNDFDGKLPDFPEGQKTPGEIRRFLRMAEEKSPFEISQGAVNALDAADEGSLTIGQVRALAEDLKKAATGLGQSQETWVDVSPSNSRKRKGNPFGSHAGLRVSRTDYPRRKARAFMRRPQRWLGHLALWGTTLRLTADAGGIRQRFKPGFILEDGTVGMASKRQGARHALIYIHPDRFQEEVKANKERPLVIASFLHGVACHELTHLDGRMGEGHGEGFVSAREDLGRRTAHLLPALAILAVKYLKLPQKDDELKRLRQQLEKTMQARKEAVQKGRKAARALERQLEMCMRELTETGEALSAHTRASCTGSCGCRRTASEDTATALDVMARGEGGAAALLSHIARLARANLPQGVDEAYFDAFVRRNRTALETIIQRQLEALG